MAKRAVEPLSPIADERRADVAAALTTATRLIAAVTFLLIPLRIVSLGFVPDDDALVDAAKSITGRPWTDILVLKPEFTLDPHVAWHALLRVIALNTGMSAHALVVLLVVSLFALFAWSALLLAQRPEAWMAALLIVAGAGNGFVERFVRGRPFIISAAALVAILWMWQRSEGRDPSRRQTVAMGLVVGIASLLHGSWYLWALPAAAFAIARQTSWARAFSIAAIGGVIAAALVSGHPVDFPLTSFRMGLSAFGSQIAQPTLVAEFQPMAGNIFGLLLIFGLLALRRLRTPHLVGARTSLWRNPAFILGCLGWVLGFKAMRFWSDWGLVALLVVLAAEIAIEMEARISDDSPQRMAVALALGAALFVAATNDANGRWSTGPTGTYEAMFRAPDIDAWLPEPGGILYSADMETFYQTFYQYPSARWRYIVGFEPALMPDADYAVYAGIMRSHGSPSAYQPWIDRMRPADRVLLRAPSQPNVPKLEWKDEGGFWLGRLPRT